MNYVHKPGEKLIEILVENSVRQVGYIVNCKRNVEELNQRLEELESERKTVQHQVDDAINNLGVVKENVKGWLERAEDIISKGVEFQYDKGHQKTGCSWSLLPFLWHRNRLGRKANKVAAEVKLVIGDSKFDGEVSHPNNPTFVEDALCNNRGYVEFPSREVIMDQIMEKLKDPAVRMIGVCGASGVGKTTLVSAIASKAREKLFSVIATVAVTANPNPREIQDGIAYVLGLKFEGEGEIGRADRLRRRLKKERERGNALLILDDLWDGLDLNKLGIPLDEDGDDDGLDLNKWGIPLEADGDDDLSSMSKGKMDFESKKGGGEMDPGYLRVKKDKSPGDYNGCKILLTSRFRDVLSNEMNVENNSIFPVKELDKNEAMMLFMKVAEVQHENSKLIEETIEYCAGLPMAVIIVGKALRNESKSVWEATLENLKNEKLMQFCVKLIYDHLENKELKSIFLLSARMGYQPLVMDLVRYCFGLGILEGVDTLTKARDRISISLNKLKDSSLVLASNSIYHFKMHDMIKAAALSIARKEENVFTLRNEKLHDWPDNDELERCTVISIHNCDILEQLPEVINCPQLEVLHIDIDDPFFKFLTDFLKE